MRAHAVARASRKPGLTPFVIESLRLGIWIKKLVAHHTFVIYTCDTPPAWVVIDAAI
jgi:hypothetical protein